MGYQTVFGVLLISSSTIAFIGGIYAVNGVIKTKINIQLIQICFALLIWALGLTITLTAANIEICSIGHIIAPVGWGPMSSLLMHFTLLLTGKDKLLKKWWFYLILYLPGLLMIFAFTILPLIGQNADSFIKTIYGWTPVVQNDFWDYIFYTYYIGYSVVNIIILLITRINTRDKKVRAQVTILAIAYSIAYTFGTISDVLLGQMNIMIPQLAPIFSIIAIGAIVYSVYRYKPLDPQNINQNEIILTDDVRKNVYNMTCFMFLAGSIIHMLSRRLLYEESNLSYMNLFDLVLILIAAFIFVINRLKFSNDFKDLLVAIAYSIVIPSLILRFVEYGSITIWAFMLPIMVICLLYNKRIMLLSVIISSVMTQIVVWTMAPVAMVEVNEADHIVRLGFIIVTAVMAVYVNSIYIARLKYNSIYDQKRKLLSDISQNLISAEEQNMDEKLYNLLEQSGKLIGCDRAYIVLFERDLDTITYSSEWLAEGKQSQLKAFKNLDSGIRNKIIKQFESKKVIKLPDSMLLPPIEEEFKKLLAEQNICGLINMTIKENNRILGFMGFNSSNPLREWDVYSNDFLEIIASLVSDTITRIEKEKKIKALAYYDQLTRLPNRVLFKERLKQEINRAIRTEKMVAVIFIDIDSFKSVNDTLGHALGDRLLVEASQILSRSIRNYDLVSRFDGDGFIIMINQLSNTKDCISIMDKIMGAINRPFDLQGQEFFITASAGVAFYPQDGENVDTLIKNADTAMYKAKEMGKNRYVICSKDMKNQVSEKVQLTNYLYRALEREQLMLYYQPQVSIETNTIVGFEALLRWNLPDRGMISPATFIPIAEQTGLINSIGEWVLDNACMQSRIWKDKGYPALRMAVNVSVNQLNNPEFVKQVDSVIKRTGLHPEDLELEITESAAGSNVDAVAGILSKLKKIGVFIAIDDFGTEYSSLSRLKILQIDRIKIDRQFVNGIEGNEKDQAIAKAIISLAKKMNLKVIAEGVETKYQLDFLRKWMCDEIQGYYFYKPMPAEEIEKLLI